MVGGGSDVIIGIVAQLCTGHGGGGDGGGIVLARNQMDLLDTAQTETN